MITIELKWNKNISKKTYKNTNELALNMYYLDFKRKKNIKPKDVIIKYKLNQKYTWKKENITEQIDNITYNI
jgi:hypothetical protein